MKRGLIIIAILFTTLLAVNVSAMLIAQCSDTDYLRQNADIIVIGKINSVQDLLENTNIEIQVEEYTKGTGDNAIKAIALGGQTVIVEDQPIFSSDDIGKKFKFYLKKGVPNTILCGLEGVKEISGECLEDADCPSAKCLGGIAKCVNEVCVTSRCSIEEEINLPPAGSLPGSSGYKLKIWWENLRARLILKEENRQIFKIKLLGQRLAELKKLQEIGKAELVVELAKKYETSLAEIENDADKLRALGKNTTLLQEHIVNMTYKHIIVLESVLEKVPDSAKDAIEHAINVSQRGYENALSHIKGKEKEREEVEVEIEKNASDRIKVEIQQDHINITKVDVKTQTVNREFELSTTNREEIITQISAITGITKSYIEEIIKFEIKTETEENVRECYLDTECGIGGCGSEICTKRDKADIIVTACMYKQEYSCLRKTTCSCIEGKCQWDKKITAYKECMTLLNATHTCTDSDGGKEYYTKGTTTGNTPSEPTTNIAGTYNDICTTNTLKEYYCEDNLVKSVEYNCREGCTAGACVFAAGGPVCGNGHCEGELETCPQDCK